MTNNKGFFDYNPGELNFVPFDIETTGFKATEGDFVTNIILHNNDNYHIWINTNENTEVDYTEIQNEVTEGSGINDIVLYLCKDETTMLLNVEEYLSEQTGEGTILTAFNGETYRGNTDFDVPFLRTRCFRNGIGWILSGYWYTDSFEVLSQQNRFDTTVKSEPTLEDMKKADLIQFQKDMGLGISIGSMKKNEIVNRLKQHEGITLSMLQKWSESHLSYEETPESVEGFNKGELKDFIDSKSLDIPYGKLTKSELVREIRNREYEEKMLVDWHEQTGRDIGNEEITDLDGIHEVMVEDKLQNDSWRETLPFEVELFDPFDPYESSGEAVTGYMNQDYAGVILHCFADVARTVNLTQMMVEYAPKQDYRPKTL